MKRLCLFFLLFALLLCSCKKDTQGEESGSAAVRTYQLPTEWTVTRLDKTYHYTVIYDQDTVTLSKDGEAVTSFTLDRSGNVIRRENADGQKLEAVYDADGCLTSTLRRDSNGELRQRIAYDEHGRAVREYTVGVHDKVSLRTFTYGEDGRPLTESQYSDYQSYTYEYHANGEISAKTAYLLDLLPFERLEYDENGRLTWGYGYDKDGNLYTRREFDEDGNVIARYDKDGNPYAVSVGSEEKTYDDNGNLTELKSYNDDGSLRWRDVYEYDRDGNQTAWLQYDSDGNVSYESYMTYDEGVLVKTLERVYDLNTEKLLYTDEFEWDAYGNCTKSNAYDPEGNPISGRTQAFEYIADEWRLTLADVYGPDGELQSRQELTYDKDGNNIGDFYYDGDGNSDGRTEMTYDGSGNNTRTVRYDRNGNESEREEKVYDEHNNLKEYTSYRKGELAGHTVYENSYEYDEAGRIERYGTATLKRSLTYTYENGSGLWKESAAEVDGKVARSCETVYDNNGNPRIERSVDEDFSSRREYEWSEEGALRSYTRYSGEKETLFCRLEAGGYTPCSLTEAQYRRLLELLLVETDEVKYGYYILSEDRWF